MPVMETAAADELLLSSVAEPLPRAPGPEAKRYGWRIGSFGFLVRAQTRSEVVRGPVVSTVPHAPAWLLGMMNLRGHLVPVADLAALCGAARSTRAPATVLVLDAGERAIAIPIDTLPRPVTGLQPLADVPALPATIAPHVSGVFAAADGEWIDFNHEEFFRALAREPGAPS